MAGGDLFWETPMKSIRQWLVWVVVCLVPLLAWGAEPASPLTFKQFTGRVSMQSEKQQVEGTYFREGDKVRIEPATVQKGDKKMTVTGMAILVDWAAGQIRVLNNKQKLYTEMQQSSMMAKQVPFPRTPMDMAAVVSRATVGQETLQGHPTTVEDMVLTDREGKPWKARVWSATDLGGFPLKAELRDEKARLTVVSFSDVRLEPQAATLFNVPADFKKSVKASPDQAP
jgi:hypothetical protein